MGDALTADARDKPDNPEPPRLGMVVAVCLELSIVATLTVHHSIVGLLLCVAYSRFSASWAYFRR